MDLKSLVAFLTSNLPIISLLLSGVSLILSIIALRYRHKEIRMLEKEREMRTIVEVYRAALYNWLTYLESKKRDLEKKKFDISYDARKRRLRSFTFEGWLGVSGAHEFEKDLILSRIEQINKEIIEKRSKVIDSLNELYRELESFIVKHLDTKQFRDKCQKIIQEWEMACKPRRLSDFTDIVEGVVRFLIDGEIDSVVRKLFEVEAIKDELCRLREDIKKNLCWQNIEKLRAQALEEIKDFYNLLNKVADKHMREYKLSLENLKP